MGNEDEKKFQNSIYSMVQEQLRELETSPENQERLVGKLQTTV